MVKRLNLTNQKPERRATQQDERAVKRWLKEEWPKIREHRRRWQAMLYFMDESGVSLTAVMGKTWEPKGKTPVVKTTGNRGGLCVTSAISPAGKMTFRIEKGKVNAGRHIEFLIQIMKQHPNRKIIDDILRTLKVCLRANLPTAECGFPALPSQRDALSDFSPLLFHETERTDMKTSLSIFAMPTMVTLQELIQPRNAHVRAGLPEQLFLFRVPMLPVVCKHP